jgi:hypothetical protein
MSKSNKYQIQIYNGLSNNFGVELMINIKKLNLMIYVHNKNLIIRPALKQFTSGKIINNFLIESDLINLLISKDNLNNELAVQILKIRLNERTIQNTT